MIYNREYDAITDREWRYPESRYVQQKAAENRICIRLNTDFSERERRNKLRKCEEVLCKKYPKLKGLPAGIRLDTILEMAFREGLVKRVYIRNLTFTSETSGFPVKLLGIRLTRTPGDELSFYLPDNISLLFKGHVTGKEFIVDAFYEVEDTKKLDFEIAEDIYPYRSPLRIYGSNFLYDVLGTVESLTESTDKNLEEWNEYLKWKGELAKCQLHGCKYYKVAFDQEKKWLVFWLVFDSKEQFQGFKRYLGRDIQIFDNAYSTERWHFKFSGDISDSRFQYNRMEVGRFKKVVDEYYLNEVEEELANRESPQEEMLTQEQDDEVDADYEGYEEDEQGNPEEELREHFEHPYIVQAAYELNQSTLDEISRKNMTQEEIIQYVQDKVLPRYFRDGFLALSAVGEFVLIKRFMQAINQLKKDESYAPNLAMWLFDITKARVPEKAEVVVDRWLNDRIAKNENQKQAVYKMLTAPDICLIQGPPGTGKTTVIAEAIYQFVKKGYRVLLASQSNDAVDNALERLADTPEIRAIRLGQKGRRQKKEEEEYTNKFAEDEALKCFYHALSLRLEQDWLNDWEALETNGAEYEADIRDVTLYGQDLAELNKEYEGKNRQYEEKRKEYQAFNEQLSAASETNMAIQSEKQQYEILADRFHGRSEESFYLSNDMLRIFEAVWNPLVESTEKKGIYMTNGLLDFDAMGAGTENAYIEIAMKNINTLKGLREKVFHASGKHVDEDGEILLLQSRLTEAKQKMLECMEQEDEEGEAVYKKQWRTLQKQMDEMKFASSLISISEMESRMLSNEARQWINSGASEQVIEVLDQVIFDWHSAFEQAIVKIGEYLQGRNLIDTEQISKDLDIIQTKYIFLKNEIQQLKETIDSKRQTLIRLRGKYGLEGARVDEIVEYIRTLREENSTKLRELQEFRDDWEKTIRGLKDRLDEEDVFLYDQEYYQQTYINACNVVGISCTDNMRNLSDHGYDDFDVVIIDEVSKATPPELLIPLMKARKAILVGDHRQLPPMFKEHEKSYRELTQDQEDMAEDVKNLLTEENFKRFKHMVTSSLFKDYFEQADERIKHSLIVQYRMHSDIMDVINRFYEQRLASGLTAEEETIQKNHGLTIRGVDGSAFIVPERHAYWIDSSQLPGGTPVYETFHNNSTSACNIFERHIIIELLKKFAEEYREQGYSRENPKTVGVISFYQMQVNELRDALKREMKTFDFSALEVDINTVDRFQGKEKNIIITSLVRNNKSARASRHVVAFERINVAFSRAQELLLIVGAKHMYENAMVELPNMDMPGFKTAPTYKNIMDDLHRKACFRASDKIITPEMEEIIWNEYIKNGGKK